MEWSKSDGRGWARRGVALAMGLCALAGGGEVRAGELRLEAGVTGVGSAWRGDGGGYAGLKLGYRFADVVGIYVQGQEGYGVVDERMLTLLSLGGQLWGRLGPTRPYLRLAFLHQHEESLSVVANDFGAALFGVGDGIRHRAGGELGLGVEGTLLAREGWSMFAGGEASAKLFPDSLGPMVYAGAGVSLGVSYAL